MRTVILRNVRHELLTAFRPRVMWPVDQPPDIVQWGSRQFVFSTMNADSMTFTEAASFPMIEGATAETLSQPDLALISVVEPPPAETV